MGKCFFVTGCSFCVINKWLYERLKKSTTSKALMHMCIQSRMWTDSHAAEKHCYTLLQNTDSRCCKVMIHAAAKQWFTLLMNSWSEQHLYISAAYNKPFIQWPLHNGLHNRVYIFKCMSSCKLMVTDANFGKSVIAIYGIGKM